MKQIFNKRYLRDLPDDQFDALRDFLYAGVSSNMEAHELREKMDSLKENRKKSRGVFIETACGESHHIEPKQEVERVYVKGRVVYERSEFINKGE